MQAWQHQFTVSVTQELMAILTWWKNYAVDNTYGGFYGKVHANNTPEATANKGLILHARILWAFAKGYKHTDDASYKLMAERAFNFIINNFADKQHGGYHSTITYNGDAVIAHKEGVAHAYLLYAFAEYASIVTNAVIDKQIHAVEALLSTCFYDADTKMYRLTVAHNITTAPITEIYIEAQLHVLEALSNRYHYVPSTTLQMQLTEIIQCLTTYFYNNKTKHFNRVLNLQYKSLNNNINYGHNMETAWLLYDAAKKINNTALIEITSRILLDVCESIQEATDADGGIWCDKINDNMVYEKHWWTQTEALIGLGYAYNITNNTAYLNRAYYLWQYIQQYFIDKTFGEWHFGRDVNNNILYNQAKVDYWKCPYHNVRACTELITLLT